MGTGYLQGGPYNIKLRFDLLQLNTYELIFIRVLKGRKKKRPVILEGKHEPGYVKNKL